MSEAVLVTMMMEFKPDVVDAVCAGFPALVEETRKFKGYRSLTMRRHAENSSKVIIIEEWESTEDYRAYVDWRMSGGGSEAFAASLAAPPQRDYWSPKIV